MLEADIILEAADEQPHCQACVQDADNHDPRPGGEPDSQIGQRRIPQSRAQAQKERGKSQVRDQPSGKRHPLQDPDDESGKDHGECYTTAEDAALENIIAA